MIFFKVKALLYPLSANHVSLLVLLIFKNEIQPFLSFFFFCGPVGGGEGMNGKFYFHIIRHDLEVSVSIIEICHLENHEKKQRTKKQYRFKILALPCPNTTEKKEETSHRRPCDETTDIGIKYGLAS